MRKFTLSLAAIALSIGLFTLNSSAQCTSCPSFDYSITPTSAWQTDSWNITSGGCYLYQVPVTSGLSYNFKTGCADGATADFDTYLELLDTTCSLIADNDDGCENRRSSIYWTSNYTGYVYLKVSGYLASFGNYTLAYQSCNAMPYFSYYNSGDTVDFYDGSTGGIVKWQWNFGDSYVGNLFDSLQNPTHIYRCPGKYIVGLQVTNANGCTNYISWQITVAGDLSAFFTDSVSGNTVHFTNGSTGDITNWQWDFGDGKTSTLQNPPSHAYCTGVYYPLLKVTNTNGCTSTYMDTSGVNMTPWKMKTNFGGAVRETAVGFSIGNKAYIGTGDEANPYVVFKDFWQWDQLTNIWTQKADFGGAARTNAVGFSIGAKGYIGTGVDNTGAMFKDFWQYDTTANTWTRKADFPGIERWGAVGFSIKNKGYIGMGLDINNIYKKDFWQYDTTANNWTRKADFGGTARFGAVALSIGNKGYVGTGQDPAGLAQRDFWQYDTTANSWMRKADFGGTARTLAVGFSIGNKGYVGTGGDAGLVQQDFWQYDTTANSWTRQADFGGTARYQAVGFSIGNKGYIGTGSYGILPNTVCLNNFWEYDPSLSISISSYTVAPVSCGQYNNGSIALTLSGGTPPYTYLWSDGQDSSVAANLAQGSYYPTLVTDANGCTFSSATPINVSNTTGPWSLQQNFGGVARDGSVGFAIGNKGYIGMGWDVNGSYQQDFWQWDQTTNIWTQQADFGGTARVQAVGFSIGTKGYVGTGYDVNGNYQQDFWEYNPSANTWISKANFSGTARYGAVGFSIGTKGYIGTGYDVNGNYQQDFWEWNQAANSWTKKANFSGGKRDAAVGFSIGTKGYIGTGGDAANVFHDFWEWNQAMNVWSKKANFEGVARHNAVGFSIGIKGYIGTGSDSTDNNQQDFWEWNQAANSWTRKADIMGTERAYAVGFSIGTKGYIGTGRDVDYNPYNDFWQYNPSEDVTITSTTPVSCYGGSNGAATVTIASGSAAPYTYLWDNGATASTAAALSGGTHLVTVTDANNCPRTGLVVIKQANAAITATITSTPSACSPPNGTATVKESGGLAPYSYLWSNAQTTKTATGLSAANYMVNITDSLGCTIDEWKLISSMPNPSAYILSYNHVSCFGLCDGSAIGNATGGSPPYHYLWNTLPAQTTSSASDLCAGVYSMNVIDNQGCINTVPASVTILQPASLTVSLSVTPASCGSPSGSIDANTSGGITPYTYSWSNGTTSKTAASVRNGSYSVTITDKNGCATTANDSVGLYTLSAPLCIVTVDSTSSKNVIVWEKPAPGAIKGVNLYREIASVDNYIAYVPYNSMSEYTDMTNGVNPNITAYKYKISVVDTCDNESALSAFHQTIHLSVSPAVPCGFNLSWNDYVGFPITQYRILRDSAHTGWKAKDSVSYGNTSWTDNTCYPSNGAVSYMLEIDNPFGCTVSLKQPQPMKSNLNSSRSNVYRVEENTDQVTEMSSDLLTSVYPNPSSGFFTIYMKNNISGSAIIKVFNMMGEEVFEAPSLKGDRQTINLSNQAQGVYSLQISTSEQTITKKLVVD